MSNPKLYHYYGNYGGDYDYYYVTKVSESAEDAETVVAQEILDNERVDIDDFYCDCSDSDCEACTNPESDYAREYAEERALDYIKEELRDYGYIQIDRYPIDGYNIVLTKNTPVIMKGVPTWD